MIAASEVGEQHYTPELTARAEMHTRYQQEACDLVGKLYPAQQAKQQSYLPAAYSVAGNFNTRSMYLVPKNNHGANARENVMEQEEKWCRNSGHVVILYMMKGFYFWFLSSLLGYNLGAFWVH